MTVALFQVAQRETKSYRVFVGRKSLVDSDINSSTYNPFGRFDLSAGPSVLRYRWKKSVNDDDPAILIKLSSTPGEIDFEPQTALPWTETSTLGEALVKLVPADTDPTLVPEMIPGGFFWDLWLILTGGEQILLQPPTAINLIKAIGP